MCYSFNYVSFYIEDMDKSEVKASGKDQCLVDSATTHTILKSKEYFT